MLQEIWVFNSTEQLRVQHRYLLEVKLKNLIYCRSFLSTQIERGCQLLYVQEVLLNYTPKEQIALLKVDYLMTKN